MPIDYTKPPVVTPEETVKVYKRRLVVEWVDADEKNNGITFSVEREDGARPEFKADGRQLDEPLAALGVKTLREFFDGVGDALLAVDPTQYVRQE